MYVYIYIDIYYLKQIYKYLLFFIDYGYILVCKTGSWGRGLYEANSHIHTNKFAYINLIIEITVKQ